MTTVSLTAGLPPRDRLELGGLAALLGMVAALQLSIAVAQICLALACLCWVTSNVWHGRRLEAPRFFWALVAYAALTLLSASFARNAAASVADCRQLTLFLLVPLVYDLARGSRARSMLSLILTIGAASAIIGITQYGILNYDNLNQRVQGTLSHWMTYSGTLMLVICAAVARLLYDTRDRAWALAIMPALVVGLALTLTRSAWVGTAAGVGVLFLMKDFRLLALLPIAAVLTLTFGPAALTNRVYSIGDMQDETNRDRMAMLQAGAAIVAEHPLTGVGPDQIAVVYPAYRVPSAVKASNLHLHNVPMQIAAERGLPALAAWIWFVALLSGGLLWLFKRGRHRALTAAAVSAVVAMLIAGLFEYNFGDSEFLMLFLVLVTLPFAAERDGGLP
ncbi:MAG: O-antigen ligase family protein [Vicinamibacterales bacterium]